MTVRTIGIIMNGVTGRMGTRQHLIRSIVAIRKQGGVQLPNGDMIMPNPILVGRNEDKLLLLMSLLSKCGNLQPPMESARIQMAWRC